jgi:hypothetical protein
LRTRFFQAKSSREKLKVTFEHAKKILSYFQVMAAYVDFMSVFAVEAGRPDQKIDPVDLRFSSFREHVVLSPLTKGGLSLPFLGLGGRGYQLCYNLKCIANQDKEADPTGYTEVNRSTWTWSPRQAVFHHQFDMENGTSLWVITAARTQLQSRMQELLGDSGRAEDKRFRDVYSSFISSLSVHILLAQWASHDWRGHLRWLEQEIEENVRKTSTHYSFGQVDKM